MRQYNTTYLYHSNQLKLNPLRNSRQYFKPAPQFYMNIWISTEKSIAWFQMISYTMYSTL